MDDNDCESKKAGMKFIVVQIGARHHYAIPRILERAGALWALYTDACANKGIGRWLSVILPGFACTGQIARLLQRSVTGLPPGKIKSTDRLLFQQMFGSHQADDAAAFALVMKKWGTGKATGVYSMFGEGLDFLRWAKALGLTISVEIFITPIAHQIVAEEQRRFPEWEEPRNDDHERIEARVREVIEVADVLLCPGENVVDGLQAYENFVLAKARVVPYGSGANFQGRINQPIAGRVLFAGTAELRKGIHYFAAAARRLASASGSHDLRVAGNVTDRIRQRPECAALNFLGRLTRAEMIEELLRADVLVLPTLAEGSASVINEALVIGLPVITTASAGSVVRHGVDGLIIPERDPEALAEAIRQIIFQRELRNEMSKNCVERAHMVTETAWSERLMMALSALDVGKC
jgi:glycosyltransferase involved in cell wall biosynthesis